MRILIVDDHALMRNALRTLIEYDFPNADIDTAADLPGAISKLESQLGIDLVLLDLAMEGEYGISALRRVLARFPEVPVVVVSGNEDLVTRDASLREGAVGYYVKKADTAVLRDTIAKIVGECEKTAQGQGTSLGSPSPPPRDRKATATNQQRAHEQLVASGKRDMTSRLPLTRRQADVAILLAQGKSNKEIALDLGIAEQTVKQYVSLIFRLLGVNNRAKAATALSGLLS